MICCYCKKEITEYNLLSTGEKVYMAIPIYSVGVAHIGCLLEYQIKYIRKNNKSHFLKLEENASRKSKLSRED